MPAYRVVQVCESKGVDHEIHLFVDTANASASAIGDLIEEVGEKTDASLIILARHNKVVFRKGSVGFEVCHCTNSC